MILFLEVLYLFLGGLFLFLEVLFLILPFGGLCLSLVLEGLFLNSILRGFDPILRGFVPILRWFVPIPRGFVPNFTLRGVVSARMSGVFAMRGGLVGRRIIRMKTKTWWLE